MKLRPWWLLTLALVSCKQPPKGTPFTPEDLPADNLAAQYHVWAYQTIELTKQGELGQALYAANQSADLAHRCYRTSDAPECLSAWEHQGSAIMGSLGTVLLWRQSLVDSLVRQANLRTTNGAARFGLAAAEEALKINDSIPQVHQSRADALFALKRYDEAMASYDQGIALRGQVYVMAIRKARCLLHLGKVDDANTLVAETREKLDELVGKHPELGTSSVSEVALARIEFDAFDAEVPQPR